MPDEDFDDLRKFLKENKNEEPEKVTLDEFMKTETKNIAVERNLIEPTPAEIEEQFVQETRIVVEKPKKKVPTDTLRTIHYLLTGRSSRQTTKILVDDIQQHLEELK